MNAVKYKDFLFRKLILAFHKFYRDLGIVQGRAKMMHGMVAVIPAYFIVLRINTIDCVFFWVVWVDKGMLSPVAQHHHYTGKQKTE